jgi:hypothetical protein
MADKKEAMDRLIAQDADLIDPQPTQTDALKIARGRITEWCDAVAVEWGQGSQTHNVARDGRDIVLAALRQPQTDALKIALWHLERIRDVEDIDPVWAAMSALAAIDAALKESK